MKKTEEELDKLHSMVMENLYEVFEEELDTYFKFREAALNVMAHGTGTFPFSTHYDCAISEIDKSLDIIDKNIVDYIQEQLKVIFEEREKKFTHKCKHSEKLKKEFSDKLKQSIRGSFLQKE